MRANPSMASSFNVDGITMQTGSTTGEALVAYDPYQFGRDRFSTKKRMVVDHISSLARSEETAVVSLGGVEFQSTTARKLQHEKLTMAQYQEGALRILRAMVLEDGIAQEQVMDYINYMIQVAVFAQGYPWINVLSYDKVYREEQYDLGFRWGTASPFLMTSRLQRPLTSSHTQDNKKKGQASANKTTATAQPRDPKTGNIICQKFNGVNGCSLPRCSYAHVCRSCFADHPEHQHKRGSEQPKN